MLTLRRLAKEITILFMGRERRPRRILRGLASGYRMIVSPTENLGYLLGTVEPHLQKAIRRYVSQGQTVYDIGANIGYVSLSLSKQVGPKGTVIAFEPIPESISRLRANIEVNQVSNIRVIDYAVSDSIGDIVIRIAGNLATASVVWHSKDSSAVALSVRTITIDELVSAEEVPRPAFVKIDVEGAEALVLKGMRRTIAEAQPVIFVECSDAGRQSSWDLLQELGYRCQFATTDKPVSSFDNYQHSDFLWLPPQP